MPPGYDIRHPPAASLRFPPQDPGGSLASVTRPGTWGGMLLKTLGWNAPENPQRYRVTTRTMCVVVEFASDAELVVVTAWRIG